MQVEAPFPGMVTKVPIAVGATVAAEDTICVIEMMKMEQKVEAGAAGTVVAIRVQVGDLVDVGTVVAEITGE